MFIDKFFAKNRIAKPNNETNNIDSKYQKMEDYYTDFIKKAERSDFANSPRRFVAELKIVEQLIEQAKTKNLTQKAEIYAAKKAEILAKLKEFGISYNKE